MIFKDVLDTCRISKISKGKIGELIAVEYFKLKGYYIWIFERFPLYEPIQKYANFYYLSDVISYEERSVIYRYRTWDMLIVKREDFNKLHQEINELINSILNDLSEKYSEMINVVKGILHILEGPEESILYQFKEELYKKIWREDTFGLNSRLDSHKEFIENLNSLIDRYHDVLNQLFPRVERLLVDVKTVWSCTLNRYPDFDYKYFKPTHPEAIEKVKKRGFKFMQLLIRIPLHHLQFTWKSL